jgi:hypothetical protein
MSKTKEKDILYRIAKGKSVTPQERESVKHLIKDFGDGSKVTRAGINQYYDAATSGRTHLSYNDFTSNRLIGDRRKRGGRASDIRSENAEGTMAAVLMGWFVWGLAIYWLSGGSASVKSSAVIGAIIAVVLYFVARRWTPFTEFLLPIILTVIGYMNS